MESKNGSNGSSINNNSTGSDAPTASGFGSGSGTGASDLLTSGLTTSLMAEELVSFLDRASVLRCMAVSQVENQFQLTNYYCQNMEASWSAKRLFVKSFERIPAGEKKKTAMTTA
ncbi:expressed unknown protein [Seminavis robusta]|uniref:Uncharacterized protein n=1 Tax=Seminavis robusta TaxID=568900 RepID=A0A9N8HXZ7_9STRA|nr:expressed unknown protein [Seminavis robusta]|eukprot:Sro2638_g333360.1 n/a (115) ;mRNA; r:3395-3739